MTLDVKVYDNGDHVSLVWLPSDGKSIPNCLGFTIHKSLKANAGATAVESYVGGFVGFSDQDKFDPNAPWKFPIQRYMWWDYLVQPGNVVQYSIVPVIGPDKDHLQPSQPDASAQTLPMTVSGPGVSACLVLFQQRRRIGAVGVALAQSHPPEREARRSHWPNKPARQLAAQCAERPASPKIAAIARRREEERRRDLCRAI